ncbi:glutathione S-transferase family protein [Nannocystis punicea]|uniref:Glutathione S-transferase family protein n=1 Tax=Nannocystis punicea TaxID=2995304 RepID=A0ABY7GY37_9BACT|nr:glutathione S-transferase family protein [Nannocystis poenicansa]WAS91734.1 glutathione S-transferase family protein [Nannocystis poenicansa]
MPKLSYFDIPGSRGEECRLALHLAGVAFEDDRIKDWPPRKEQTPYGSVPTFEVEGRGVLAQTNAILVYIGREHGLHPRDNWLAARHEELMLAVEDLRAAVGPVLRIQDPEERVKAREELASGFLKRWGRAVERRLNDLGAGPFVSGDAIQVADLKLYMVVRWLSSGTVDHVPRDVFAEFPRLTALERAVAQHPKILAWYAR